MLQYNLLILLELLAQNNHPTMHSKNHRVITPMNQPQKQTFATPKNNLHKKQYRAQKSAHTQQQPRSNKQRRNGY